MTNDLANLRRDYALAQLDEYSVALDPIDQFNQWMNDARHAELPEPNAMTLATVDANSQPQARVLLLKEVSAKGFVFYTNYTSAKGQELDQNPRATMVFLWLELERQVRINGRVSKLSGAEADDYFASRPRSSQLGALASQQSQVVANRAELDERYAALEREYHNRPIPRPAYWGGYRLQPDLLEFWQGRRSRLHDRLRYRLNSEGGWRLERLQP